MRPPFFARIRARRAAAGVGNEPTTVTPGFVENLRTELLAAHVAQAEEGTPPGMHEHRLPDLLPRIEDSPAYKTAIDMHRDLMDAMTLENTPAAYVNDELDYGTEAGDAPIVEDAGTDWLETKLIEFLVAHPELSAVKDFRSYYPEVVTAERGDGVEL